MATPTVEPIVLISSSPPEQHEPDYNIISPVKLSHQRRAKSSTSPSRKPAKLLKAGSKTAPIPEGACQGFQSASSLAEGLDFDGFKKRAQRAPPSKTEEKETETRDGNVRPQTVEKKSGKLADSSKLKLDRKSSRQACQGLKKPESSDSETSAVEKKSARGFQTHRYQEREQSRLDTNPPREVSHWNEASSQWREPKGQAKLQGRITKPNTPAAGVLKPVFKPPSTTVPRVVSKHFSTSACEDETFHDFDLTSKSESRKDIKGSSGQAVFTNDTSKADNPNNANTSGSSHDEIRVIKEFRNQFELNDGVLQRQPLTSTLKPDETEQKETDRIANEMDKPPAKVENHSDKSLRERFGYQADSLDLREAPVHLQLEDGPSKKRQKLRNNETSKLSRNPSPSKKQKSASKGVRTITGLVTAPYQAKEDPENGANALETDRRHFLLGAAGTVSAKKRTSKSKQSQKKVPKLLEPERAMKKMETQEVFFATSSQLTSKESLSYIRDVQQATKESETLASAANEQAGENDSSCKLWNVGARAEDGSLLEPEPPASESNSHADSFVDVDSIQINSPVATTTASSNLKSIPSLRCLDHTKNSIVEDSRYALTQVSGNVNVSSSPTKIQIMTQTASMHTVAEGEESTLTKRNKNSSKEEGTKAKRSRGRPRKEPSENAPKKKAKSKSKASKGQDSSSSKRKADNEAQVTTKSAEIDDGFQPIDEIEDSDPEPTSSPSRKKKRKKQVGKDSEEPNNAPTQLELTPVSQKKTFIDPVVLRKKQQAIFFSHLSRSLFPVITRAVKSSSAPAAISQTGKTEKAQRQPSWHEKMLLYDPIVLEDITDWLNDGALRQAGFDYDHEFNAASEASEKATEDFAPQPNEEERNGKKKPKSRRKRVHEEESNGNGGKRVMPWMVQRWCEEHSICCLWGEGIRGGIKPGKY